MSLYIEISWCFNKYAIYPLLKLLFLAAQLAIFCMSIHFFMGKVLYVHIFLFGCSVIKTKIFGIKSLAKRLAFEKRSLVKEFPCKYFCTIFPFFNLNSLITFLLSTLSFIYYLWSFLVWFVSNFSSILFLLLIDKNRTVYRSGWKKISERMSVEIVEKSTW